MVTSKRSIFRRTVSRQAGFTLIELVIVVTIIGILAGIAVVNVRSAQRKAAENVLRADLTNMRKAIDDFYADRQRYPSSLQELVEIGYMRRIPVDPISKSADTWIEVSEEPDAESFSWDSQTEPMQPGIIDVLSGAEGETLEGVPYGEL
ncbi:MAG TPA: prepilin-type N-terminal cleavage/methylation domain-containing protein [Thermoanaerobaculia bacterium]|nr:prepilin-type N-terminal cleavage/methylation domain-containing protein [Thermoanaerobaculia bacterium]